MHDVMIVSISNGIMFNIISILIIINNDIVILDSGIAEHAASDDHSYESVTESELSCTMLSLFFMSIFALR